MTLWNWKQVVLLIWLADQRSKHPVVHLWLLFHCTHCLKGGEEIAILESKKWWVEVSVLLTGPFQVPTHFKHWLHLRTQFCHLSYITGLLDGCYIANVMSHLWWIVHFCNGRVLSESKPDWRVIEENWSTAKKEPFGAFYRRIKGEITQLEDNHQAPAGQSGRHHRPQQSAVNVSPELYSGRAKQRHFAKP